jgi:hypothetical protein
LRRFAVLLPIAAFAAEAPAPVVDIMDVAVATWGETPTDDWYFDDAHLANNFSKAFVAAYREAEKHPAYDEDDGVGSPFDYDVIANGQDGCPFKDITYTMEPEAAGVTLVHVEFDNRSCAGPDYAGKTTKVDFKVVTEDGKPLIDDILTQPEEDAEPTNSILQNMADIAKGE